MKNYINILLDAEFELSFPFECKDFSSRCIASMLYEPLFNKKDGVYSSNYIKNHYLNTKDHSITLELFDGLFFSNGQKLTSTSIYKTLLYQIMNRTMFSYYLDFIEGVPSILYDDIHHGDIGIIDIVDKNMLKIVYNRQVDYCDLFSNVEFSPVYFNENNYPELHVSNGKFKIFKIKEYQITLERNGYCLNKYENIKYVNFIVNKNLYYPIELYRKGNVDVTSCTYFPNELVAHEKVINKESNIFFILGMKKEFVIFKSAFKKLLTDYINKNLLNILSPLNGYFFDNDLEYKECHIVNNISPKEINIAYLDYYPNEHIIFVLCDFLSNLGLKINLHGFDIHTYCKIDKSKYDIYLTLSVLLTENNYDLSIFYMSYLDSKDIEQYLKILNSEGPEDDYKNQSEYLLSHALCLPICRGRFIYMKSSHLKNFYISDKGVYNF
ncbi:extracellular solute-binding protein (family 5) [Bisgaardia hudsonensis]|uniref:Extracellular solute-binding protein (Family 5) n=1 Tax=Bisgaardia hudsonensis TaxID=109472 RepID=A0A4R2N3C5_9PAST|nr:ABC transporter substrate-binding protein [Bisgaardia hudsonensis]QLB12800.1 ABC transporter substrate-binding protein [Bisgaardia hudsonensis]TCP14357.1 extracellular solute-binding protein (family 5) [Bisgaardia hudsonensis]